MATKDTKETKEVPPLNRRAIFSKTGKGVQESSGKTSHLSRADRAVLKEIDGKTTVADIALKFDNIAAAKFDALIQQLDKDGFVREVSSGAAPEPITPIRKVTPAPPPKAPSAGEGLDFSKAAAPPKQGGGDGDFLDFTQVISTPKSAPPPKGPTVDLAAAARAQAEAKAKEQAATDYRARQEAEAKAAAEAKARAEAEARARAQAEAKAKADAEARARAEEAKAAEAAAKAAAEARAKAEGEAKARAAEVEAKAKQARDMALRMASEAKAKAEAESKEKARLEAELKGKLEEERKAREEAEKRAAEAAEHARKELEEKSKRDAEEMRQRLEAEMKAKLEEERKAREEEDRKRKEEHERREKEHERREQEAAERRAKEEAERKQREEEDRKRREEQERRHKEEDERREKERAERRAREDAERKEDERREKEREERRAKEDAERKGREEEDRKRRQDAERREKEESERRAREESARKKEEIAKPAAPAAAAGAGDLGSLLDDLDSFGQKEEEERKAKEEAEKKAKAEAEARARAEEERKRREEEERKRREEEERRAKAEAERKAKEEEERREREEEERRKAEEAERKRKAKEAQEKKQAEERAAAQRAQEATIPPRSKAPARPAGKDDDIGVSDEDLDMDDVKRDEAAVSKEARKAAKERDEAAAAAMRPAARPKQWGKPVAIALFVILLGGVGALHVMPLSTADYEKAASGALGAPVKVSSARLSVLTGVKVNLEGVTIGDAKVNLVRGYPEIGSLFGAKKVFSRLELEGTALSQAQLGEAIFGKAGGDNFRVGRIVFKHVRLEGPLAIAPVDIEATIASDGSVQTVHITGENKLSVKITPGSGGNASFEVSAPSLAVPFVPALSLSDFGWKGTATRQGITSSEFDGRAFDGVVSGNARVRWGSSWSAEGEVRARGVKVAVFAPTLVSDGKVEGRGNYTMSGSDPAKLGESARLDGSFKIENGVIGNFDLGRALQTGGAQTQGRTEFSEMTGQGVYDKGAVQLRNLAIASRAMAAGASLDIDAGGALAGRIAAEVKTPNQTLKAVLNISGSLQNPVIRK